MLLFDAVTVKSVRLREVPFFVRTFGGAGLRQLLAAGALRISSEFTAIGTDFLRDGVRHVPLSHFTFGVIDMKDREGVLASELRSLEGVPGLRNRERAALQETILAGLVRPPPDHGSRLMSQIESDLRRNTPMLEALIAKQLSTRAAAGGRRLEVRVEETQERTFHIITNLVRDFGMSEAEAHELLKGSVVALANMNHRLADMEAYSAITGFADSEAPLLFGRLAAVIAAQNPRPVEEHFARVVTIANLPDMSPWGRVDVEALLEARQSSECREFRAWLATLDEFSDAQIAEMVGGLRHRVACVISGAPGRMARLVATTAVGLIPVVGPAAGAVVGAIDSFLLDRMFPSSGAFAFLDRTYPSLFLPGP